MRGFSIILGPLFALSISTGSLAASAAFVPPRALETEITAALERRNVGGLGLAVIRDGKVVWTGYYGEQAPGVPVTAQTMFNTASVAKTIITETVLRLVDRGDLSLDDPIADFYQHPHLAHDPRYRKLTPRVILSHQTGLLNWPYLYEDRKLAFVHDPGTGEISYSGAAVEMLAKYLEQRFGKSYPELVEDVLFEPLGVEGIEVRREAWMDGRVPHPLDSDGNYHAPFTRYPGGKVVPVGEWSAADNLFATVEGYADFLTKVIQDDRLSTRMIAEREKLHSSSDSTPGYHCVLPPESCPDPIGYGVGWSLYGEPNGIVLHHGGSDFGEQAQAYFNRETGDGLVIFMNGNDFGSAVRIAGTIDPHLRMVGHFRALVERVGAQESE